MTAPRILLLGSQGQVGWELQRSLAPLGEVIALARAGAVNAPAQRFERETGQRLCGDLAQPDTLAETVRAVAPQVIVNAAAYTAVDKAEQDQEIAHAVNAVAPGVLAHEAAQLGAWLLHYSTDYVFSGEGDKPWREGDAAAPQNVYGRTKLEGEQRIADAGGQFVILRTSWVYGLRGGNFARTMLRLAQTREQLQVVGDQVGAPTGAELIADVSAHVLRMLSNTSRGEGADAGAANPAIAGIYHVAAAGAASWYEYARYVLELAQAKGLALRVQPRQVQTITTADYPTPARRPANSRLDTVKLREQFGLVMPPWQQGVARWAEVFLSKD